jgi:hypothetical protein
LPRNFFCFKFKLIVLQHGFYQIHGFYKID